MKENCAGEVPTEAERRQKIPHLEDLIYVAKAPNGIAATVKKQKRKTLKTSFRVTLYEKKQLT